MRTSNSLRTSTCSGVGNWVISDELAGVKMIWKEAMRRKEYGIGEVRSRLEEVD